MLLLDYPNDLNCFFEKTILYIKHPLNLNALEHFQILEDLKNQAQTVLFQAIPISYKFNLQLENPQTQKLFLLSLLFSFSSS